MCIHNPSYTAQFSGQTTTYLRYIVMPHSCMMLLCNVLKFANYVCLQCIYIIYQPNGGGNSPKYNIYPKNRSPFLLKRIFRVTNPIPRVGFDRCKCLPCILRFLRDSKTWWHEAMPAMISAPWRSFFHTKYQAQQAFRDFRSLRFS